MWKERIIRKKIGAKNGGGKNIEIEGARDYFVLLFQLFVRPRAHSSPKAPILTKLRRPDCTLAN